MIYTANVGGEVRVTLGGIERQHLSESYRGVHDVIFVDRSFRSMNPPIFYCDKGIPASMYRLANFCNKRLIYAGVNGLNSWRLDSHNESCRCINFGWSLRSEI